jgi:hypothetical protein
MNNSACNRYMGHYSCATSNWPATDYCHLLEQGQLIEPAQHQETGNSEDANNQETAIRDCWAHGRLPL